MKENGKAVGQEMQQTAGTGVALVREAMVPIVEDLKDFVRSTVTSAVKASESVLRQDISTLQVAVSEHSGMIKKLSADIQGVHTELKGEIQGVRTELKGEIQGLRTELKGEIQGLRTELKEEIQGVRTELKGEIQGLRTELKEEMHQMEHRLSDKLDGHAARLDDHESRIKAIERVA